MYRLVIIILLIQLASLGVLSEESYDDDPLSFLESHNSRYRFLKSLNNNDESHGLLQDMNYPSRSERLLPLMDDLESEYEDEEQFARPTRSQDRNDNFIRFGRGNSDFIRFGRDPYKYNRGIRGNDQNFLRFGRSTGPEKKRSKRSAELENKRGSDSFLRFGKSGDDSFIRYGRNKNGFKKQILDLYPVPTASHPLMNRFGPHYPLVINEKLLHRYPLFSILKKLEDEARQSH